MLGLLLRPLLCVVLLSGCARQGLDRAKPSKKVRDEEAAAINARLATAYLLKGDPLRAKQKILLALDQAPKWPPALSVMGYVLAESGELKLAEDYFRQSIRLGGRSGALHNNYGVFLCQQAGRPRDSLTEFEKAAEDIRYVEVSAAYENAGFCAKKLHEPSLELGYFEKAVQHDPRRTRCWLELARLYLKAQQKNKARLALMRYREHGGLEADPRVRRYQALLESSEHSESASKARGVRPELFDRPLRARVIQGESLVSVGASDKRTSDE